MFTGGSMSTLRSCCWFVSLLGASTAAQQSDPLAAPASRQTWLEDAFLAARQLPERVEINGRILIVADLVRAAREAGVADEGIARSCLDRVVLAILRDRLVQTKAWLDDAAHEAAYAEYAEPYRVVQLNADQQFSFDRDRLVQMLDEALRRNAR